MTFHVGFIWGQVAMRRAVCAPSELRDLKVWWMMRGMAFSVALAFFGLMIGHSESGHWGAACPCSRAVATQSQTRAYPAAPRTAADAASRLHPARPPLGPGGPPPPSGR